MTETAAKDFDMADAFDEIEAKGTPELVETTDAAEVEPVAEAGRERDEHGRFKPKEATPAETLDTPAETPAPTPAEVPQSVAAPEVSEPSQYLPKALKEAWGGLTPQVREAIETREREAHEKITRVDTERQIGRSFDSTVAEYRDMISAEGGTPLAAVRDLLETARVMRAGTPEQKAQMLNLVATRFGIDIEAAYHARPAPEVARLQLENNQRTAELAQYRSRDQQEASARNADAVAQWATDKPFFNEPGVADEIARLITAGVTNDVDKAYRIAIAANDSLRSASVEAAVQDRLRTEEAKQNALVAKARRGAVSPPSAPGSAKPPGSANLNHREAMDLAYDEIVARGTA